MKKLLTIILCIFVLIGASYLYLDRSLKNKRTSSDSHYVGIRTIAYMKSIVLSLQMFEKDTHRLPNALSETSEYNPSLKQAIELGITYKKFESEKDVFELCAPYADKESGQKNTKTEVWTVISGTLCLKGYMTTQGLAGSTTIEKPFSVPAMKYHLEKEFGFSFWYPEEWKLKESSNIEFNPYTNGTVTKQLILTNGDYQILISEFTSPTLSITLPGGACGSCTPVSFLFDKNRHTWMTRDLLSSSGVEGKVDASKVLHPADISNNTMGGLHIFSTNQRGDFTQVVPLSARNFVVVEAITKSGHDVYLNEKGIPLARTIVATDKDVAVPLTKEEQEKIVNEIRKDYNN